MGYHGCGHDALDALGVSGFGDHGSGYFAHDAGCAAAVDEGVVGGCEGGGEGGGGGEVRGARCLCRLWFRS